MLETRRAARRQAALAPAAAAGPVRPLPAVSRFSLRLKPHGALATVASLRLDTPVNRWAGQNGRLAARVGPDEWLLIGPEAETDTMASEIGRALAGRVFALVDTSHRSVAIEVAGPHAAEILNAGCPLDLHPGAFPCGSATRTVLGKAEVVLMRTSEAPTYRVECWRSFAAYAHTFLIEAARDFAPAVRPEAD